MTPVRVGIIAAAFLLALALVAGVHPFLVLGLAIVVGLIAFLNAHEWNTYERADFGDVATTLAPGVAAGTSGSIDISEELADLLKSASYHAQRLLEDTGSLEPFVMYEDVGGSVRVRKVRETDPAKVLRRARRTALELDETAPRVIVVTLGLAQVGKQTRRVVAYEAAERGHRERTLSFVQPYSPRRLVLGPRLAGSPRYAGELDHPLRYARKQVAQPSPNPGDISAAGAGT